MRSTLGDKQFEMLEADAKVPVVSRSIHYGLFLAFEGIRLYCRKGSGGEIEVIFLNRHKNLERF